MHIYSKILLSHKKEWMWISWTEVGEPRACYTDWSKSEMQNKYCILTHTHTHIESRRMVLMNLSVCSNRGTGVENGLVNTV